MNRKRILVVDHAEIVGGAELYVLELFERLNRERYSVCFVTSSIALQNLIKQKGFECELFTSGRLKTANPVALAYNVFSTFRKLKSILKIRQSDLIQTNTVRMHIIGALLAYILHKPLVWIIHSYDFNKFLFKILSPIPKTIIFVSQSVQQGYISVIPKNNKTFVLTNGFNFDLLKMVDRSFVPRTYSVNNTTKVIGMIGRIERQKGQEYFIRSIPLILNKYPDVLFLVVGDPNKNQMDYYEQLCNLVKKLGIENKVVFSGHINNIYDLIGGVDVLVAPSTGDESFGRILMEALALECPVVATRVKGYTDIIEDRISGLIVPIADSVAIANAVNEIFANPELAVKMVSHGRKKIQDNYDLRESTRKYEKILVGITG